MLAAQSLYTTAPALQDRSARDIDRLQLAQKDDKRQLKELSVQLERTAADRDRTRTELTRREAELTTIRVQNERLIAATGRAAAKSAVRRPRTRRAARRAHK